MSEPQPTQSELVSRALLELGESVAQVQEAVVGYRAQCEARGFSPTAAEAMALEYHSELMRLLFAGAGQKP